MERETTPCRVAATERGPSRTALFDTREFKKGAVFGQGATVSFDDDTLTITPPTAAGSHGVYYRGNISADLRDAGFIQVFASQVLAENNAESSMSLKSTGTNLVRMGFSGNSALLQFGKDIGGVWTTIASVPYDVNTMQYWRIREASGSLYADYSADAETWVNLGSTTAPFALDELEVGFTCKTTSGYAGSTAPGSCIFDEFNDVAEE
jgi:hypothetical protein